jgi:hypothetical protein
VRTLPFAAVTRTRRARAARPKEPLPPALPPAERTVGQLVAESIRLYGRRFWPALLLGLPLAVADQLALDLNALGRVLVLVAFAPVFTLGYAVGTTLAVPDRPGGRWWVAMLVGTVVFVPAALFFPWFALASVAWLGLAGLVVPVALIERTGLRATIRRAVQLGRADYVHAAGSLATLVLLFWMTRIALALVLRSQADNTVRVAVFLADVVLAPLLFLGPALLYFDQVARVGSPSRRARRRSTSDADLPDADDAHRTGRPDAQVESRPPA